MSILYFPQKDIERNEPVNLALLERRVCWPCVAIWCGPPAAFVTLLAWWLR